MPSMRIPALIALTLLARASTVTAQSERGGFIYRLGVDTVTVESYSRAGNRIEGLIARRAPQASLLRYTITLNADNSVASYEQQSVRPEGPILTITFTGDSMIRNIMQQGQPVTLRAAAPRGTVPALGSSSVTLGLTIAAARRGEAYQIGVGAQQQAPARADIRLFGVDSAEFVQGGFRTGLRTDAGGRVIRYDGSLTTAKYVGTVDDRIDARQVADAWSAAEAAGGRMGAASTRDTVRATLGAASVVIDYGRPAKRGREIWGALVPFDTTWRLGANAATNVRTDRDLEINGVTVPAGHYTLFLLPTRSGATLIVNKQTGQWGTAYDAAQDLVRIPMTLRSTLPTQEERFTIRIDGGELVLHWGRGGYSAPVRAK